MAQNMMADDGSRSRLGRGLAALIGDVGEEQAALERSRSSRRVPIEFLKPNPRNPRRSFPDAELDDLANSIRERGIIQPILVRTVPGLIDAYEIIAGERRWRAAQRAGLHDVPVLLIEADDKTALEFAIIENVQRSDLNAIDEALGYDQLMKDYSYTQNELSQVIGKSRSHVANTLRLLNLPEVVRVSVVNGDLSAGHARALLSVDDPETMARQIIENGMSVREIERSVQGQKEPKARSAAAPKAPKDPNIADIEQQLQRQLGLHVSIMSKGEGGELRIRYQTFDQIDRLCEVLSGADRASRP